LATVFEVVLSKIRKRYRADQVGSLLRPPDVLHARTAHAEGRLSLEQLRAKEDEAIDAALSRQHEIGIDVFTDGEIRRGGWLTDMAEAVEGFVSQRVELEWKGPGGSREPSIAFAAGAKLKQHRKLTANDLPFLKRNAQGPFKLTVPAPSNFLVASYKEGITNKSYPARAEFLADLVEIVRGEIQWLISEGVLYVQLDAPYYSHYLDDKQRERLRTAGRNPDSELDMAIEGDNACLKGLPRADVTVAVHVCRGNNRSRWYTEGGYDAIAERLFASLDVDRFLLEYDSERSGTFEPLRFVPRGKDVVLGLITTKDPHPESVDELQRRIDEASRYVPVENLAISPQCGFASVAAGNLLSSEDQWRKLQLVVKVARKIWN
jgi:5-methyltetrahydropteroyltriglutamate--homocysteine methyltransferase